MDKFNLPKLKTFVFQKNTIKKVNIQPISLLDMLSFKCHCDFQVEMSKGQNEISNVEVWREIELKG